MKASERTVEMLHTPFNQLPVKLQEYVRVSLEGIPICMDAFYTLMYHYAVLVEGHEHDADEGYTPTHEARRFFDIKESTDEV